MTCIRVFALHIERAFSATYVSNNRVWALGRSPFIIARSCKCVTQFTDDVSGNSSERC